MKLPRSMSPKDRNSKFEADNIKPANIIFRKYSIVNFHTGIPVYSRDNITADVVGIDYVNTMFINKTIDTSSGDYARLIRLGWRYYPESKTWVIYKHFEPCILADIDIPVWDVYDLRKRLFVDGSKYPY